MANDKDKKLKKVRAMKRAKVMIQGTPAFYIHNRVRKIPSVVFLHGEGFNAKTWVDTESMQMLADNGISAISMDLPNTLHSYTTNLYPETWLKAFLDRTKIFNPVIVTPSIAGSYTIPFMFKNKSRISGLVAVAPVDLQKYQGKYASLNIPVLAIWGEEDTTVPVNYGDSLIGEIKNGNGSKKDKSKIKKIKNAGHAPFMDNPKEFNDILLDFLVNDVG